MPRLNISSRERSGKMLIENAMENRGQKGEMLSCSSLAALAAAVQCRKLSWRMVLLQT